MSGDLRGQAAVEDAQYWDTLRRSLTDRANAFSIYMAQLAASNGRRDDGFSRALKMCEIFGEVLRAQVERDWEESAKPASRYVAVSERLKRFIECERWIDRRFARGIQGEVPRALKTIAREYLEFHGLTDHEPVLTLGPPDSFETHQTSLYDYLFTDLPVAVEHESLTQFTSPTLSIISVPYIEGTTTLWHPITLGHEIAHLRIDATRSHEPRAEMMKKFIDPSTEPRVAALIEGGLRKEMTKTPSEVLNRWIDELLCDLNAVRLFGPAGLSAVAEFVGVLGSSEGAAEVPRATHPPLSLRLRVMCTFLERMCPGRFPDHARVWGQYYVNVANSLDRGTEVDRETTGVLTELLGAKERIEQMIDHVCDWERPFEAVDRPRAVEWIRDSLLDGIPGGTHFEDVDGVWRKVSVADVVNGAWAARDAFEPAAAESPPGGSSRSRGLLVDLDTGLMPEHEKRRKIDTLASKAVDSVELARLWGERNSHRYGIISPDDALLKSSGSDPPATGAAGDQVGVLSAGPIVRRVTQPAPGSPERLVITPMFANSVHEAGIDVRLGPEFIVFKHASSAVFDPLAEDKDPRELQESVHMGWGEQFILHPKELVLAATLEYIVLPADIAAQVITRSSYGRLGLTTATAVQVQPGSRGCITLELVNHGDTPIALSPGMRVGQLMLFSVAEARPSNFRRYWFPIGPEFSKVDHDEDAQALLTLGREAKRIGGRGTVPFLFVGEPVHIENFGEIAERHFTFEFQSRNGERALRGTASADALAQALRSFLRSYNRGARVSAMSTNDPRDVGIVVRLTTQDVSGVSFHAADGEGCVETILADSSHGRIADAIARFRARRRGSHALAGDAEQGI